MAMPTRCETRGAIRPNLHTGRNDFASQCFAVLHGARAGAGKADIERLDPESLHQVKDLYLLSDARVMH
jgi:hypothetical protein